MNGYVKFEVRRAVAFLVAVLLVVIGEHIVSTLPGVPHGGTTAWVWYLTVMAWAWFILVAASVFLLALFIGHGRRYNDRRRHR